MLPAGLSLGIVSISPARSSAIISYRFFSRLICQTKIQQTVRTGYLWGLAMIIQYKIGYQQVKGFHFTEYSND